MSVDRVKSMLKRERWQGEGRTVALRVAEGLVLIGLGLLLYGDSINLPFFFDDPLQLQWAEGNSLLELWRGAGSIGYYRPLTSTLWRLSLWFTGAFNARLLHALNVGLHILNAVLVAALTRRVLPGPDHSYAGLVGGLLFLSYPFSYQAVPWVSSLTHPLVTSLAMGAVLSAIKAHAVSGWRWRALSLGLTIAAFFAHESGITIGGALLGYELLCTKASGMQGRRGRISKWPVVYLALGAAYVPLYFALPRGSSPLPALTLERLTQNATYLLQGLAYPLAPLVRWTTEHWGWSDLSAARLASAVAVGLLIVLSWREKILRVLMFSLFCFALWVVPAWLALSFSYMISGPRVLYLASTSAAIAWVCGFQALAHLGRRWWRALSSGFSLVLILLTVGFGYHFVRVRQGLHRLGGDLIWQASQTIRATAANEQLLVINYPAWLSLDHTVYPVGHEGVEFMPGYVGIGDLVWINNGVRREVRTAKFSNALVQLPGLYTGVRGPEVPWEGLAERIRAADRVFAVNLTPEALRFLPLGHLGKVHAADATPLATFGGRAMLTAADVTSACQGELVVRLTWRAESPLDDGDYRVFAHVYDVSGALVTQSDGYPLGGLYPFWLWGAGERVEEVRHLTLPGAPVAPDQSADYQVAIGIYEGASGERLAAIAPDGTRYPADAVPVDVIRCSTFHDSLDTR